MHPEKPNNSVNAKLNKLSSLLFYFCLFVFIVALAFPHNPAGNWYQQFMPNIGGRQIADITFVDSLTGYAVTNNLSAGDTGYVLKTTNGGDNWSYNFITNRRFSKVKFIDINTGFACGGSGGGTPQLYKTTTAGANWFLLSSAGCALWGDMFVLNNDTLWLVDGDGFCGGVFRTTNGGLNWTQQLNIGSSNPNHIYMVNSRIGFIAEDFNYLRKTTNSGVNWSVVPSVEGFLDMHFVDTLTGWKSYGTMKKTTDGGNNWITQTLPSGGQLLSSGMGKFSVLNRDTILGVGGQIQAGVSTIRGIIFRTVDGGANWLFQTPDTAYGNFNYYHIQFTDKYHGWAYTTVRGIHTTTGGDPVWITGITQISNNVPKDFMLFQNYPNPFNPKTIIKYQITKSKYVSLVIYDITGKQITDLVNRKQSPGTYEVDFSGNGYSSGVYFYSLITDGTVIDTKKMILIK